MKMQHRTAHRLIWSLATLAVIALLYFGITGIPDYPDNEPLEKTNILVQSENGLFVVAQRNELPAICYTKKNNLTVPKVLYSADKDLDDSDWPVNTNHVRDTAAFILLTDYYGKEVFDWLTYPERK